MLFTSHSSGVLLIKILSNGRYIVSRYCIIFFFVGPYIPLTLVLHKYYDDKEILCYRYTSCFDWRGGGGKSVSPPTYLILIVSN